jgi:hypothetical protein
MKKQLSLWLVSFYTEFIALLLNSFLGLLFWPSLTRGGGLWPFPATLAVVSWFSVSLEGGAWASRMWVFGPCKLFLASSWLRAFLACLVGFGLLLRLILSGSGLSAPFSHRARGEGIWTPNNQLHSQTINPLGTWLSDPLTILFLLINFWCSRTFWLLTH